MMNSTEFRNDGVKGPGETAATAFANEKGELRGGDYPVYAITDAANPRDRARVLSVKNVTARVVANGRLGYPAAFYRRGRPDKADAIISWSTNMSAQGFVEFGKDRNYGRRIEATDAVGRKDANVLRVILRDLEPRTAIPLSRWRPSWKWQGNRIQRRPHIGYEANGGGGN